MTVEGYDLDEAERKALTTLDVGALYAMGTRPVIYQRSVPIDGVPAR